MKKLLEALRGCFGVPENRTPELVIVHRKKGALLYICATEADVKEAINEGLKGNPKGWAVHIERHLLV